MKVLLDTNVILRLRLEPERLKDEIVDLLSSDMTDLVVSTVSPWEIAIKWRVGRLPIPDRPATWMPRVISDFGATVLPISLDHVLGVADLPDHHGDPFDRLLIAQARAEKMAIVTTDRAFAAYDVDVIAAR